MATTIVATKSTVLVYSEAQMNKQIADKFPHVKNPQKNWLKVTAGYLTNGQMDQIYYAMEFIFDDINAGLPFTKRYVWEYATPQLQGLYVVVYDADKAIIPQLCNDIHSTIQRLCDEDGFTITSDNRTVPGWYQQLDTDKTKSTTP
jgi:hypothetical protein